ncbi:hypothetical protein B5M44_24125 [Shinella sumterensis]|uniref:hypothetical protein n=1 Tax=Shinella sumterensis TaxID=1967501 RepID=UPI00106DF28E|nr:hypothetical protein [Shinella sumterensis]MCD1264559.1 hypothetical protein [Shinella sumterensis]TFE94110.1 hypothetical protein B5M44_24125 [Shinella sumterensis]
MSIDLDHARRLRTASTGSVLPILLLTAFSAVLALWSAASPPAFSPDAANYLHAGHSWSIGQVDTVAYKIGSRIYVVLAYYLPQLVFGVTIDTITITLAGFALLTFFTISAWCYATLERPGAFWVSLALILVAAVWIEWDRPLTENIFTPLALASLGMFDVAQRRETGGQAVAWMLAASACCGLTFGVRPESLFLFCGMLAATGLSYRHKRFSRSGASALVAGMITVYAATCIIPPVVFKGFTGKELPYQIKEYFLFYRPVAFFGDAAFGPASRELAGKVQADRLGTLPKEEVMVSGIGQSIVIDGPEYASKLYGRVGIETLKAVPMEVTQDVAASLLRYLFSPSTRFKVGDGKTYDQRMQDAKKWLIERDHRRERRAYFEGPNPFNLTTFTDNRLSLSPVIDAFGRLPPIKFSPPPAGVTLFFCVVTVLAWRWGKLRSPYTASILFFGMSIALAAFSQGFIMRYWQSASLLAVIAATMLIAQHMSKKRLKVDQA